MESDTILVMSKGKTIRDAWINAFDRMLEYCDEHIPAEKIDGGYIIKFELHKPTKEETK